MLCSILLITGVIQLIKSCSCLTSCVIPVIDGADNAVVLSLFLPLILGHQGSFCQHFEYSDQMRSLRNIKKICRKIPNILVLVQTCLELHESAEMNYNVAHVMVIMIMSLKPDMMVIMIMSLTTRYYGDNDHVLDNQI